MGHSPILCHGQYQRLSNRRSLRGPTQEIRGRLEKKPHCHPTTGYPQNIRGLRRDPAVVPRDHAHKPRIGSARSS